MIKKYNDFLVSYHSIVDEKERLAFFRGFTLSLTAVQAERFLQLNLKNGVAALQELLPKQPQEAQQFIDASKDLIEQIRERYAVLA
ncbi:MAG: hypothetical protein RLZZ292_3643 [Bacteroidota bacterium]|jgi:hypothetical protein